MTEDDGSGMPGIGDIITAIKWVADFISTPKGTANVGSDQGSWRMSANDVAHHETALILHLGPRPIRRTPERRQAST